MVAVNCTRVEVTDSVPLMLRYLREAEMEEKLLEMLATLAGIVNDNVLFAKFIEVPVGIKTFKF